MEYRFYIDDIEIDEPVGWNDFELSLKRDDTFHGMQFEASTGTLQFYGVAADYLQEQRKLLGLKATPVFKAQVICGTDPVEEIIGVLNMGKYKKDCAINCLVSLPLEEQSCAIQFKSKFDQKVNIDDAVAFDRVTPLPTYVQLGQEMDLPPKSILKATDGSVGTVYDVVDISLTGGINATVINVRPTYDVERNNSIATGQLVPVSNWDSPSDDLQLPMSPQLLYEDDPRCFDGNFPYDVVLEGGATIMEGPNPLTVTAKLVKWDGNGDIFTNGQIVEQQLVGTPFNVHFTGTVTLTEGIGLYAYIEYLYGSGLFDIRIITTFTSNTKFTVQATQLCPPTPVEYYMLHEVLSRIAESITNGCLRAYSEYYGRIDSQPFAFPEDGCGSLRFLTSGLKIRRAPEDTFFASAKDVLDGLRAIDNIGFGIEQDPQSADGFVLRIETLDYFYQDTELLRLDFAPSVSNETQEQLAYSRILVGYKKWEVENVNGLDEFNSNREYRTSLDTINNTLDATSALVAGGYAIEITRQQSFAETGAADTRYDNDTFIICVQRNAYDFIVEQGNIDSQQNIFDPATVLNFRLSPVRNLMRWYRSIAPSYAIISDTESKLFFSAGTGNITASGMLSDASCRLEAMAIAENQDLFVTNFANPSDYLPLWKAEHNAVRYPLSIADYKKIKANPYGYISVQCGTGEYEEGYIQELTYRPAKGIATFTLKAKYAV